MLAQVRIRSAYVILAIVPCNDYTWHDKAGLELGMENPHRWLRAEAPC